MHKKKRRQSKGRSPLIPASPSSSSLAAEEKASPVPPPLSMEKPRGSTIRLFGEIDLKPAKPAPKELSPASSEPDDDTSPLAQLTDVETGEAAGASLEADPEFLQYATASFLPTTNFTFLLDLQEPIGFEALSGRRGPIVSNVERGGQGQLARLEAKRCVVKRVGHDHIHTVEELDLEIVKRRITSAMFRQERLENGDETATPLTELDEELLANKDALEGLMTPQEVTKKINEFKRAGQDVFTTITYVERNFNIERHLPSDYRAFKNIATLVRPEEYWESCDFMLSRYKASVRLYELVAFVRKTLAVFLGVFLAEKNVQIQARAMLGMVLVSFLLHCRLLPYDDQNPMNSFNTADAALSNNTLEMYLLVLQMCQLVFGLVTEEIDLPPWFLALIYHLIVLLAVVLSLIALSSQLSKNLHEVYQRVEPYIHYLARRLGLTSGRRKDTSGDDAAAAGEKRKRRGALLNLAKSIETKQKEKARKSVALEVLSSETVGTKARVEATRRHKEALAAGKRDVQLHKEHDAYERRVQKNSRRSSKGLMVTKTDDIGHLSAVTESMVANAAVRERRIEERRDASRMMERERSAWEARRRDQSRSRSRSRSVDDVWNRNGNRNGNGGGGGFHTTPDRLPAHLVQHTVASSHHHDEVASGREKEDASVKHLRDALSAEGRKGRESWLERERGGTLGTCMDDVKASALTQSWKNRLSGG